MLALRLWGSGNILLYGGCDPQRQRLPWTAAAFHITLILLHLQFCQLHSHSEVSPSPWMDGDKLATLLTNQLCNGSETVSIHKNTYIRCDPQRQRLPRMAATFHKYYIFTKHITSASFRDPPEPNPVHGWTEINESMTSTANRL